ncbi:membrane-spanning 4-domains subfamily A member 5 isoform X2 [Zalophus californianus]|uniref:Membrane-spanning 4-domains subfamily A member 5 isoform X2 n=1 Tax=Zalophus californianus TaxID=9704 RepID=A0A6J2BST4_ZALCA|nr:membrane-spanning 4-domains subfamily A member 5 isoform X2 [Zalophus californianus]
MDSNTAHNPVFLVFPPDINVPGLQSADPTATTYDTSSPLPKLLATKMKILGFINSGAFLVALERKTTETLVKLSQIMNSLSALAAIAGIILLTFGLILDQQFFCGYAETISQCQAVATLFTGILIMLMAFSIIELFISLSFSVMRRPF